MYKDFPKSGLVRLSAILAPNGPIPVSKSTWWAGMKSGRFPKPIKLTERVTVWRAEDVLKLTEYPREHKTGITPAEPEV